MPEENLNQPINQAPEQAAPVAVQTPAPVEAPEQPKKKSRRGVRQQRLEDTMPAAPSQPQTDFYKPNPLDGDVILDANYPVKVLPEMSAEQLKKTAFALSDNVVLLQPPSRH